MPTCTVQPQVTDRVHLADTELIIEVEKDFTVYGDEITFGGKVIRDRMGQSSRTTREGANGTLDLVITNALIIDYWGIVRGRCIFTPSIPHIVSAQVKRL